MSARGRASTATCGCRRSLPPPERPPAPGSPRGHSVLTRPARGNTPLLRQPLCLIPDPMARHPGKQARPQPEPPIQLGSANQLTAPPPAIRHPQRTTRSPPLCPTSPDPITPPACPHPQRPRLPRRLAHFATPRPDEATTQAGRTRASRSGPTDKVPPTRAQTRPPIRTAGSEPRTPRHAAGLTTAHAESRRPARARAHLRNAGEARERARGSGRGCAGRVTLPSSGTHAERPGSGPRGPSHAGGPEPRTRATRPGSEAHTPSHTARVGALRRFTRPGSGAAGRSWAAAGLAPVVT